MAEPGYSEDTAPEAQSPTEREMEEPAMTSIEPETSVQAAEEGSNTVQQPDSPSVIATYTANEEIPSSLGSEDVPVSEALPRSRPSSSRPVSARPSSSQKAGSRPSSGTVVATGTQEPLVSSSHGSRQASRPSSAQDAALETLGSRPGSAQATHADASGQHDAVEESNEASGAPEGSQEPADVRPGSHEEAEPVPDQGRRLVSAQGSTPSSAQGERPASVQGSRLGSAQGSKPGSAQGERPASVHGSRLGSAPGSKPGSAQGEQPAPVQEQRPVSVQGSRPGSMQGERPGSVQGSRPDSLPPALQQLPPLPVAAAATAASPSSKPPLSAGEYKPKASDYSHDGIRAIDVEINQGPDLPFKMVQVVLDYSQQQQKPFLGGFKNKRSGAVYHHAWTQTPKQPKYQGVERKLERETQTVKIKQRSAQTVREAATQMERPGVIIDTSEDRPKTPGRYQTSEERLAIVTAATCTIQRFWRGYQGRKRADYLRQKKREREAFLQEQELKAKQEAEEHRRREIERRMHPRTAADFEILYNELEAWRLQETRKIKQAGLPEEKEQEVLQQLLHKETKLLQTIDRLKINANHENKDMRIQKTLAEMGKPKKFDLKNGNTVEVHTPFTTRAMELMQLYNGLNLPMLTIDERLDVLLHVKWTVKEFDCNLTREIVDLIDREADLLNRGRNPRLLEGLRKRISSMFLTFIETPEFNPESARFQIVPMEFEAYLFEKLGKAISRSEGVGTETTSKWDA